MSPEPVSRAEFERLKAELAELKMTRAKKALRVLSRHKRLALLGLICVILIPITVYGFTIPNTFIAGTPTVATEINANFTAIENVLAAMEGKTWRIIYETILGADASSINISSLNGDVDVEYRVVVRLKNNTGSTSAYYLNPNGDMNSADYGFQVVQGITTSASANAAISSAGIYLCGTSPGTLCISDGFMLARTGQNRNFSTSLSQSISGTSIGLVANHASTWNNSAANITSMTIQATVPGGIGTGSYIEIWARR